MVVANLGLGDGRPTVAVVSDAVYPACWPRLVRRVELITRDRGVAEDISQDALLRLVLEIRAGRTPDNLTAWLARVSFNLAMSRGRRSQVEERRSHELVAGASGSSPEDVVIERELFRSMRRAFVELEPSDRLMLALSASGHSGAEIACRLGRSHAAVRTRLHRLRARLRARLAQLEAA